jgi:hypothetical protein
MYVSFGVPIEVERGVVQLLFSTAFPDDVVSPFVVITRDSEFWLSTFRRQTMTIVDLHVLIPLGQGSLWFTESLLESDVHKRLLDAGWLAQNVLPRYRVSSQTQLHVIDFALLGREGNPIAVVETKATPRLLGPVMEKAINAARIAGARYALATNGKQVLLYDSHGDLTVDRHGFPSPADISVEAAPLDVEPYDDKTPRVVVTVFDYGELIRNIQTMESGVLILDHTIPWGGKVHDLFAEALPEPARMTKQLDLPASILTLAAAQSSIKATVGTVTPNLCFSSSYAKLRRFLMQQFRIAALVELPPDLLRPYSGVRPTLLKFVRPESKRQQKTYFFSVSSRGDLADVLSQPWFSDYVAGFTGRPTPKGFHASVCEGEPWTLLAHNPGRKRIEEQIGKYAEAVPLGDLCIVRQGFRHSRQEVSIGKGIPVVRGRDVPAGIDSLDQVAQFRAPVNPPQTAKILSGDVLLQRIGRDVSCIVASPGLEGAFAADTVFVVRCRRADIDPFLICQFLTSAAGQTLLQSCLRGSFAPTLSVTALRSLPIPVIRGTVATDLQELAAIERALRVEADKLASRRLEVFSASSSPEFQSRLREIRQLSRSVAQSIQQAETLDFRIRNSYPYPLAFPYRTLVALTNPFDLYREQLRLAEEILSFLASVSLALVGAPDRSGLVPVLVNAWRGGASPGHWHEISRHCARLLNNYADHRLAASLATLWESRETEGFRKRVEKLIRQKNDFKHDRGPKTDDDFQQAVHDTEAQLLECMQDIAFFTEHPIRLIRDMDRIRGSQSVTLSTLRCVGDHPGLAQEQINYPEALRKNDLYIEIQPLRWLPLYPFIVSRNCPLCRTREIYFVDKWEGKGKHALLKSFERGHTEENLEVGQELDNWMSAP